MEGYFAALALILAAAAAAAAGIVRFRVRKMRRKPKVRQEDGAPLEIMQLEENAISKPLRGKVVSLEAVSDPFFLENASCGLAVIPEEGKVYAPFDGTAEAITDQGRVLSLKSTEGLILCIYIGVDTHMLHGRGFFPRIREKEAFETGDLLLEFDLDDLKKEGYDILTPIIVEAGREDQSPDKMGESE